MENQNKKIDKIYEFVLSAKKTFATKDDFNELKGDVSSLKGDVSSLKGDVNNLKETVERISIKVIDIEDEMKNFATKDFVREENNKILNVLDKIVDEHKSFKQEFTMNVAAHNRFDKRISRLEK